MAGGGEVGHKPDHLKFQEDCLVRIKAKEKLDKNKESDGDTKRRPVEWKFNSHTDSPSFFFLSFPYLAWPLLQDTTKTCLPQHREKPRTF